MDNAIDKNIRALAEAAKQDRANFDHLTEQLKLAQNAIASLALEIQAMRNQIAGLLVKVNGSRATSQ